MRFEENCPAGVIALRYGMISNLGVRDDLALSDANGDFLIRGLFPGKYSLRVTPHDPAGSYSLVSAALGEQEARVDGFDLTGQPQGSLRVTVRCSKQK